MKKLLFLVACLGTILTAGAAGHKVDFSELPARSQAFIGKNFPTEMVKNVEMERKDAKDHYTVLLSNGTKVMFDGTSGELTGVAVKEGSVPSSLVPSKVRTYMSNTYPKERIHKMAKTDKGYRFHLSNGLILHFDAQGNFTKREEHKEMKKRRGTTTRSARRPGRRSGTPADPLPEDFLPDEPGPACRSGPFAAASGQERDAPGTSRPHGIQGTRTAERDYREGAYGMSAAKSAYRQNDHAASHASANH